MTRNDEDEIEASKAPLIEHLIELRRRLIWSLLSFIVGIRHVDDFMDCDELE